MNTGADIAIERKGDWLVAHLRGEVDMSNASYVRDELIRSVPNGVLGLVIDLGEARYLDSAAIELLFELSRRLARRRQGLQLVLPPESPLQRVLGFTEVSSVAPMFATLDEALTRS